VSSRVVVGLAALAVALIGCTSPQSTKEAPSPVTTPTATTAAGPYQVLVFSRTAGFRHDSIPAGIAAIRELGTEHGFTVTATEDGAAFAAANLDRYAVVVFLNTTGDVLDAGQQSAFEAYIRSGGGYVGVHSAADTEYDWPFYGDLVGAYFAAHPAIQQATIRVEDRSHPSTAHLDATWVRTDEWYNYRTNPRSAVRVLVTLDESSYSGGTMGADHPLAWYRPFEGGRSFYTGGGHTVQAYAEPAFRAHLLGGIRYAAAPGLGRNPSGLAPERCGQRVTGPVVPVVPVVGVVPAAWPRAIASTRSSGVVPPPLP
jgi:type 1 glutamine amidotransferase